MHQVLQSSFFKVFVILLLINFPHAESYACDKNISGAVSPPNNIINSGEVGCVTGDFSGSVTVNAGGILRICGQYTFSGAINVASGAKVVITSGSSIGVIGSLTFNDFESLEYFGDPSCNAEIYAITTNSCFVTWGATPGPSGRFCNSSNVYLDGFTFIWGSGTVGLANLGRAPSLCPGGGGATPCATLLMDALKFDATLINQKAFLEWAVTEAINIDFFTIEKSTEGLNWQTVGTLNIDSKNWDQDSYSFIDPRDLENDAYYRVRQTNTDGQSLLSPVKYVSALSEENNFSIFPNPSNGDFKLSFEPNHRFEKYRIINTLGQIVCNGIIEQSSLQEVNLTKLKAGTYIIIVSAKDAVLSQSIIIK